MMKSRAIRRHHMERLKKRRRFHWGMDLLHEPKRLGQAVNTPHPCSCYMCGNPRHHFEKKTMQERRADQSHR